MYVKLLTEEFRELSSITNYKSYNVNYFYTDKYNARVKKYINIFHYPSLAINLKDYQIRCRFDNYAGSGNSEVDFFYEITNFINFILDGRLVSLYETLYYNPISNTGIYDDLFFKLKSALENHIPINLIVKYINTSLMYHHQINNINNFHKTTATYHLFCRALLIDQIRCYEASKHLLSKSKLITENQEMIDLAIDIDKGVHDEYLIYLSKEYKELCKDLYKKVKLNHKVGNLDYTIPYEHFRNINESLHNVYVKNTVNFIPKFDNLLWELYKFDTKPTRHTLEKLNTR